MPENLTEVVDAKLAFSFGEAIHATRPWHTPAATAADGRTLRFTTKGTRLYATVLEGGTTFPAGTGNAAVDTAADAARARPLGPDNGMPRAWRLA